MSNEVMQSNEVETNNLRNAARKDAGFEKILKFKKGDYFIGDDAVPTNTRFIAHTIAWTKTWIKFVDDKVVERKIYRVASGEQLPEREELDDLDKIGLVVDRNSADPWTLQNLLPLENTSTGEVFVFTSSTVGGQIAVATLCGEYAKRTKKGYLGQPIVRLAVGEMPTKKYGKVPRPDFEIVDWDDVGEIAAAETIPVVPTQHAEKAPARADMDDEIPF